MLQRDARYYPDTPDEFVPEQWLEPRAGQNTDAWIPFSYGPAHCVGRYLAKREMLMIMSMLVQTFDMRFADGFDWARWPASYQDYFVSSRGPLLVKLTPREASR